MDPMTFVEQQSRKPTELCSNRRSDILKVCRGNLVSKGGEKLTLNTFREAASHESFLETLFELFDEDGDGLIDQDDFMRPFHQQLKDEKGRHFCEILETATFAIAHEQNIRLSVFLSIFSTKRLLDKLFLVMDKNCDNVVSINEAMDFIAKLTVAQTQTSLTQENLDYLKTLFVNHCNENHEITLDNFRKIIKSKNVFFTERVFHIFDRDGSGTVSLQEFLDAVGKFSGQSMDAKIKFLFDIYDQDGDGRVQMRELRQVIKACMDENGMEFSEEQLDDLTTALFEDADPNGTGAITVDKLKAQLEKHEGLIENLSYSIEKWLVPPKPEEQNFCKKLKTSTPHQLSWGYMKNNHVFLVFFFAFVALNLALFITRMWQYRDTNGWVMVARGCGQCLNFTCMFILVLMLRKSITWLRSRGVSAFLPLDEHIWMHKLTGYLIFLYSVGHTVAHIGNLVLEGQNKKAKDKDDDDDDDDVAEYVIKMLFTDARGVGWIGGIAYPTGVVLLVILIIMVICSQSFVRKGGKFEVFYWTHRLYILFFIFCFIHGPRFWHWFIAPCIIFIIEMVLRMSQRRTGHGRTHITEAVLLPSKVTHLVIKRPPNFHFHPGDYVFIKIPTIAKYEWHPFTISSAPEQSDVVWLHIRGVGEWTNQLNSHINKQFQIILAAQNPKAIEPPAPKRPSIFARGSRYLKRNTTLKINGDGGDSIGLSSNPRGYQAMAPPLTNSTESIVTTADGVDSSAQLKPPDKLKVLPAKSLPLFDKDMNDDHQGLTRSLSHRMDSSGSYSPIPGSSTVCVRTRTRGQSFKHMRRKPKVLPMPGLSTSIIHEEVEASESSLNEVIISPEPSAQMSTEDQLQTVTLHVPGKTSNDVVIRERVPVLSTAGSRTSFVCFDPASDSKPLEVVMDGPYGAPSSHIFRAEHAVLVGTGIGVTPFASILQSIMRRYWDARLACPKCAYTWTNQLPESYLNLRKVDFFWINRDQKSFEWFVNLLSELEIEQAEQGGAMERFLDMHMYITTALQKTDMKAVGLHLALDLLHEKEKRDLITGLKTRTHPGRPNWNKVFRQIQQQKKGRVTVFFCGPPQLARTLKLKCDEFGFNFKKEVF